MSESRTRVSEGLEGLEFLLDPDEWAKEEREMVAAVGLDRFRELAGRDPVYMAAPDGTEGSSER